MTRALPRARLPSSSLVRFLSENDMLGAAQGPEDVGQQLGEWLHFRQAIALQAVLQADPAGAATGPGSGPHGADLSAEALTRHVELVRAQLVESITRGAPPGSGWPLVQMPQDTLDDRVEPKIAFAPYRRFLSAHQRQMEATVRSLRSRVRAQLHRRGGRLQQLAALDAALENILSEREALLLDKVSKLIEKRFVQALKAHLKQPAAIRAATSPHGHADADAPTNPAGGMSRTPWLPPLGPLLRQALLAELDTRLQPTLGLLEALSSDPSSP